MNQTILITDTEPDDIIAIIVLTKCKINITHAIVIDRSIDCKWDRLDYYKQLRQHVEIPEACYLPAATVNNYLTGLNYDNPTQIICLANFLPLVHLHQSLPESTKKITVWAYGSVNMRWALNDVSKEQLLQTINAGYEKFYLFETFAAYGPINDVNMTNGADFHAHIDTSTSQLVQFFKHTVNNWNNYLRDKMVAKLVLVNPEKYTQLLTNFASVTEIYASCSKDDPSYINLKILNSMNQCWSQFVFADIGLIMAMIDYENDKNSWQQTQITMPQRFTIPDSPLCDTTCYYYKGDSDRLANHIQKLLRIIN
jgi:hypothetical protein